MRNPSRSGILATHIHLVVAEVDASSVTGRGTGNGAVPHALPNGPGLTTHLFVCILARKKKLFLTDLLTKILLQIGVNRITHFLSTIRVVN